MQDNGPRHLAVDEEGRPLGYRRVPLIRRVSLTFVRLLRTWSGRLVLAAGLVWLPLGIWFVMIGADQDLLGPVSLGVIAFGLFSLLVCGWNRDDDPARDPRTPGVWGLWDWRPDAGIVGGVCLVAVGLAGLIASMV